MTNRDDILIQKLDEFIRRYYKNQLLKGSLYAGGILLSAFLTVVLLEYFGEFNSLVRGILFFTFLSATLLVLFRYIALPLLKLNKIGERLTYTQAASIIGDHFSNVQDKLLNVLQLQNHQAMQGSDDLLLAGIRQKINELRPVPFATAIDLRQNRKYLKYVAPVFLFTLLLFIIWPQIIKKSTDRLVHYQTYYEKEMPFHFVLQNKSLEALQTADYTLEVSVEGSQIPGEVFVQMNGIEYKLDKKDKLHFAYTFSNLQNSFDFQLGASGFLSKPYHLAVLPKPTLQQFNVQLVYPTYLHKPNEVLANTGDLQIPQGTQVNWVFNTKNTNGIRLQFSDSLALPGRLSENQFGFSRKFLLSNAYSIKTVNSFVPNSPDSVSYRVNVVPDQFPLIDVTEQADSLNPKNIYFSGRIQDDYGFSNLVFHYSKYSNDSTGKAQIQSGEFPIAFSKTNVSQAYYYFFDAAQYNLLPGDKVEYYFEVFDNDGVNGAKASKSRLMLFKAPSRDEINEATSRNNSEIKKDLEESISKAKQLQKDINELSKKINDKKQLGYDEKKKLEDLLKKQQDLQNKINEIKQENQLNNKQQSEFSQTDESIMEKQKQLEELFENVMTPEMKKLFDELNKMLDKMDKNQVQEKLEELKLTNKDIEKELDRNLEAFKQLEVQQKMQNAIDKLQELRDKEEALNKETEGKKEEPKEEPKDQSKTDKNDNKQEGNKKDEQKKENEGSDKKEESNKKEDGKNQDQKEKSDKKTDPKELARKQDEIKKEFEELKKDLKELEQKNKQLEEPNKMPETAQKQEEASDEMQKSSEQLGQNKKKEASKSQKNAEQKMEEMQEQLEKAMQEEEEQQAEEDAATLRQILENLLHLSYSQEELIKALPETRIDNPKYVEIPKQQNKLKDDSKIIEDSLLALSKRVPKISAIINREISSIHANMDKTVKFLAERNVGESTVKMQSSMTSINNLALLLNEALEQMQQQMKQQQQSKSDKAGKCKKPGSGSGNNPSSKGKPKAGDMRKMQEQLNQQLQQLKEALEKGQKPGEKPGDKKGQKPGGGTGKNGNGGFNMPGSSEQFAKMAAQQEALRRQMEAMMSKLKNKGKNPGGDIANMMEETEKELVNKQLSAETMRRQQEILSRLLESEKAEKEREQDEQRKSNEAKNENLSNPEEFLQYKRLKEKEMELLNTVPPSLTPYYKDKVNTYFNTVNKP